MPMGVVVITAIPLLLAQKSSGYTLHVINESQINTLDILSSQPKNKSKIYPNPSQYQDF